MAVITVKKACQNHPSILYGSVYYLAQCYVTDTVGIGVVVVGQTFSDWLDVVSVIVVSICEDGGIVAWILGRAKIRLILNVRKLLCFWG